MDTPLICIFRRPVDYNALAFFFDHAHPHSLIAVVHLS